MAIKSTNETSNSSTPKIASPATTQKSVGNSDATWARWLSIKQGQEEQTNDWWNYAEAFGDLEQTSGLESIVTPYYKATGREVPTEFRTETQPVAQQATPALDRLRAQIAQYVENAEYNADLLASDPLKYVPKVMNYLYGNPLGKDETGEVWKWMWGLIADRPAKALRRIVGFEAQAAPKANVPAYDLRGTATYLLDRGTYPQAIQEGWGLVDAPPGFSGYNESAQYEAAVRLQAEYDAFKTSQLQAGLTEQEVRVAWKEQQQQKLAAEYTSGAEGVVTDAESLAEAWEESAGFRWSHALDFYADEYDRLRVAGVDPQTAGDMSYDPVTEANMLFLLDPNWVLPLDNLIIGTGFKAVKETAGAVFEVGTKIPGVSKVLAKATEFTGTTVANYAARHVQDFMRMAMRYLDETEQAVTAETVSKLLTEPSDEFLATLPRYYRRALVGASQYSGEIESALAKALSEPALDRAMEQVATEAVAKGGKATEKFISETAEEIARNEAISKAAASAYKTALDIYATEHPVWGVLQKATRIRNAITHNVRGVMVDTWLGLRPSWNVFNYVDNFAKLLLDGVNPLSSLPKMLNRYSTYSPDIVKSGEAASELASPRFRNIFSAKGNEEYVKLLGEHAPQQVLGSFGRSVMEDGSILRKIPGLKQFIEWNGSLGGRIETSMRTKAYLTYFFGTMDTGWRGIIKKTLEELTASGVSDDVVRVVEKRLRLIDNPTTDKVAKVFNDLLVEGRVSVVAENIGADMGPTLTHIPTDINTQLQRQLNRLVRMANVQGTGVPAAGITRAFDDAAAAIAKTQDDLSAAGRRAFDGTIPRAPRTTDEAYSMLVPSGEAAELPELARAVDDMPLLAHRATLESQALSARHWQNIAEMTANRRPVQEIMAAQDDFLLNVRKKFWDDFNTVQAETMDRLMAQVEKLTGGEVFPRELASKYLSAGRAITDVEYAKYLRWQTTRRELVYGSKLQKARDELMALTDKETDEMWQRVYPQAQADIHDALVDIRKWFVEHSGGTITEVPLEEISKNSGWWRVGQQVENIPVSSRNETQTALDELRRWYDEVLTRRTAPYQDVPVPATNREMLIAAGNRAAMDTGELVSNAIDDAVKRTNDLLFDYETTPNWMSWLGQVFPFVRFQVKNKALWIEKFAEVPHLWGAISLIRAIQAAVNRDLPSRLRYTIPIPLAKETLSALGLDNIDLRVNMWSFLSFFQTLPGSTAFQEQQLANLYKDDEDTSLQESFENTSIVAEQLGFKPWPFIEWCMGSWGLLGEDWYPQDVVGTWSPLTNWALREVFGYEYNFDIDTHLRRIAPTWWNYIFGKTSLAWEQLNPTLLEDWAWGREVEGVIMKLPDPAVAALSQITPVQARQMVSEMTPETLESLRQQVLPIFDLTSPEQAIAIPALPDFAQAVFLDEMEKIALRTAVRKRMYTTLIGNTSGLYLQITDDSEIDASKLRLEKRIEQESREPGEERRDAMKQWYEEHPKYAMVQTWRFAEHPWAESAAGREAEMWDSVVNNYKSQYYDYYANLQTLRDQAIAETYRQYPGDLQRLRKIKADFSAQRDAYVDGLNAQLKLELTQRLEQYIAAHPTDYKGIAALREGWKTDVYVPVELTDEDRETLRVFEEANPEDEEGYVRLFKQLYDKRYKEQGTTQYRQVPGLNDGITMHLEWSPVDNPNYTSKEVQSFLTNELLRDLYDAAPDKDDYTSSSDWWVAYNEYLQAMPDKALDTKQGKSQVEALMYAQGLSKSEAQEVVKGWYTYEDLVTYWRENYGPWEALEYAYQWHVISGQGDEWYDEILPLKDSDYELYRLKQADLELRASAFPATDLIKYVLDDFPGRWTVAELQQLYDGVEMPGFFERLRLNESGGDAVNSYIYYYYELLDSDSKKLVREQFGSEFSDMFLAGSADKLTIELRGSWVNALSAMLGSPIDYTTLPGVDLEIAGSSGKEKVAAGLPRVDPPNAEEFAAAQKLNLEYWRLMAAGDQAGADKISADPTYQKWFGLSSAKSYFWNVYYSLPPGPFSSGIRDNNLVSFIVDKEVSRAVATNSDYDRASDAVEVWLSENENLIEEAGLDPSEYEEVRKLISEYYAIPEENKAERKQYRQTHPLLQKYFDAGSYVSGSSSSSSSRSGGGGGGGSSSSSSSSTYQQVWTGLVSRVGASMSSVLRVLVQYWSTGVFPTGSEEYLRKLYAELGGGLTFEAWLAQLKYAWQKMGSSSYSSSSAKLSNKVPTPTYSTRTRGIRR